MISTVEAKTEQLVRESIARNMVNHVITMKRSDSLYRHYRCQTPGTWCFGFDIVTWPGSLCFTGDLGEYVFQREPDMIQFMGIVCGKDPIDYHYAAEKCRASRDGLTEFSEQKFRSRVRERLRERPRDKDAKAKARVILDEFEEYNDPHGAVRAMYESGLWDGSDLPSVQTYTFGFVLCVNAIRWFCERLSAGNVVEAAA